MFMTRSHTLLYLKKIHNVNEAKSHGLTAWLVYISEVFGMKIGERAIIAGQDQAKEDFSSELVVNRKRREREAEEDQRQAVGGREEEEEEEEEEGRASAAWKS
jgi:hypothetical protein